MNGNGTTKKIWENLRNPEYGVPQYFDIPEYDAFSEMVKDKNSRLKIYENLKSVDNKIALTLPESFTAFETMLLGNDVKSSEESSSWLEKQWWTIAPFFQKYTSVPSKAVTGVRTLVDEIANLFTEGKPGPYLESYVNEGEKELIKNPDLFLGLMGQSGYYYQHYAAPQIAKPLTDKEKHEKEIRDDIMLKKIDKILHKNYYDQVVREKQFDEDLAKTGLLDMDKRNNFWHQQAFSMGLNLPVTLLSAGTSRIPFISKSVLALGYPLFTAVESSSFAADAYYTSGQKDAEGNLIPETGDLEKTKIAKGFGIISGLFEFWGPHTALSFFKEGAQTLTKQQLLQRALKVATIEGLEEGGYQDPIQQLTMMGLGLQEEYKPMQSLEAFWGGFVGGGLLAVPGVYWRGMHMKSLKDYVEKEGKKYEEKLEKSLELGLVTKEKVEAVKEARKAVLETPEEKLQEALDKMQTHLNEAIEENNTNIQTAVNEVTQAITANDEAFKHVEGVWKDIQFKEGDKGLFEGIGRIFDGKHGEKFQQIFINAVQKSEPFIKLSDILKEQKIENPEQEIWKAVLNHPESILNRLSVKTLQDKTLNPDKTAEIEKNYEEQLIKIGYPIDQIRNNVMPGLAQKTLTAMLMEVQEYDFLDQVIPSEQQDEPFAGLEKKYTPNELDFSWEKPVRDLKGINWDPVSKHIADKFFRLNEGKGTPVYFRPAVVGKVDPVLDEIYYSIQEEFGIPAEEAKQKELVKYSKPTNEWHIQFANTRQLANEIFGLLLEKETKEDILEGESTEKLPYEIISYRELSESLEGLDEPITAIDKATVTILNAFRNTNVYDRTQIDEVIYQVLHLQSNKDLLEELKKEGIDIEDLYNIRNSYDELYSKYPKYVTWRTEIILNKWAWEAAERLVNTERRDLALGIYASAIKQIDPALTEVYKLPKRRYIPRLRKFDIYKGMVFEHSTNIILSGTPIKSVFMNLIDDEDLPFEGTPIDVTTAFVEWLNKIPPDYEIVINKEFGKKFTYVKSAEKTEDNKDYKAEIEELRAQIKTLSSDKAMREQNLPKIKEIQKLINEISSYAKEEKNTSESVTVTDFEHNLIKKFYSTIKESKLSAGEFLYKYKQFLAGELNLKYTTGSWGMESRIKNTYVGYGTTSLVDESAIDEIQGDTYLISDYDYSAGGHPYSTETGQSNIIPLVWVQIYEVTSKNGQKIIFAHELQSDILRDYLEGTKEITFPRQLKGKIPDAFEVTVPEIQRETITKSGSGISIKRIQRSITSDTVQDLISKFSFLTDEIKLDLGVVIEEAFDPDSLSLKHPIDFTDLAAQIVEGISEQANERYSGDEIDLQLNYYNGVRERQQKLWEEYHRIKANRPIRSVDKDGKVIWRRMSKEQKAFNLRELKKEIYILSLRRKRAWQGMQKYLASAHLEAVEYFFGRETGVADLNRYVTGYVNRRLDYYRSEAMLKHGAIGGDLGDVSVRRARSEKEILTGNVVRSEDDEEKQRTLRRMMAKITPKGVENTVFGYMAQNSFYIPLQFYFLQAKLNGYDKVYLPSQRAVQRSQGGLTYLLYATDEDHPLTNNYSGTTYNSALKIIANQFGIKINGIVKVPGLIHEMLEVDISNYNQQKVYFEEAIPGAPKIPENTKQQKMAEIRAEIQSKDNVKDLEEVLFKHSIENEAIKPFSDWVVKLTEDIPVQWVDDNFIIAEGTSKARAMRGNRGAYFNGTIYLNKNIAVHNEQFYSTVIHEALHKIINDAMKTNRDFQQGVTALWTEMKYRLSTDLSHIREANKEDFDRWWESPEEFADHMMTQTSAIHQVAKTTMASNDTNSTILKKFYGLVRKLLLWMQSKGRRDNEAMTFFDAMTVMFNKYLGSPNNIDYWSLTEDMVSEFGVQEEKDVYDELLNPDAQLEDLRAVKAVGEILLAEKPDIKMDPIAYVRSLSKKDFIIDSMRSEAFQKYIAASQNKTKFGYPFYEYAERLLTQMYNSAKSQFRANVLMLNMRDLNDPRIEIMSDEYIGRGNTRSSTWKPRIGLVDYIPILNELFNNTFEMYLVEGVKFDKNTVVSVNDTGSLSNINRNEYYSDIFAKKGYIFLGTFADKKTAVALKPLKPMDNQAVAEFRQMYEQRIEAFAAAYPAWKDFNSDANTQAEAVNSYIQKSEKFVTERTIRMILEDLDKGAIVVEGKLQPFLFNPELPWTGDAKKILKRPPLVAKQHHAEQDADTIERIYNHINKIENETGTKLGIGNDEKGLYTNTYIFDAKNIKPGEWIETVNFHGRQITVDMGLVLKNYFGTPTTDGIIFYLQDGFGFTYETLHGIVKKGSKKLWIGRQPDEPAFYGKGSAQKVSTKSLLGMWMQQNNIGTLMSSTVAKFGAEYKSGLGGYEIGTLQDLKAGNNSKSFRLYFKNIHRMFEKEAQNENVKGLQQSLSANMNFEGNDYFEDAGYNDFVNELISNAIGKFNETMSVMDAAAVIDRLKTRAMGEGVSAYERTMAQIILDLTYTMADKELNDKELDLLSILDKEGMKKLRVRKRFSDEQLGNTIGNLFLNPTFSDAVRGYIADKLEEVYAFRGSLEWHTIRPDIGWLDPSILETIWNQLEGTAEEKWKKFEERIDVNTGRLKDGWVYLSETAKRFNLNVNDKTILSIVPSTDMYSQYAVQIAGFLSREQAEDDSVVASSEDIQTRGGRDFDIDQLLHFYFNEQDQVVSRDNYLKFWETIRKTSEKHRKELLADYKEILSRSAIRDEEGNPIDISNLTEKDLYSEPIQIEFARLASRSKKSGINVANPYTRMMMINDKFISPVSEAVAPRKQMTTLGRINARSKITLYTKDFNKLKPVITFDLNVRHPRITSVYDAFSRFTHDFVDIPSNTNAFYYTLEKLRTIDMMYGIRDEKGRGLYEYSQERDTTKRLSSRAWAAIAMGRGITLAQSFLFENAININGDFVPGARNAERTFAETVLMIRQQQVILNLLKNGNKKELLRRFNIYAQNMLDMERNTSGQIIMYGRQYIENFEFDNLMLSPTLNLISRLDLGVIPNSLVSKKRYAAWENDIMVKMIGKSQYKEKANNIHDTHPFVTDIIKKYPDDDTNGLLMTAFLLTEDNPKLHEIKARLVSIMLPVDQIQRYTEKMPTKQYFDIYNLTNRAVFPKLFEMLLKKRSLITKPGAENTKITLKSELGNYVEIAPDREGKLRIVAVDVKDHIAAKWNSGYELLKDDSDFAQGVKYTLTTEGQLWESSNNRWLLNSIVSFGRNITPEDRLSYAEEYLREVLPQLTKEEKELLFLSLLGHPDPDNPLPAPTNFVNTQREGVSDYHYPTQRHLYELLHRLSEKDFLGRYAEIAHKAYPSKHGWTDRMQIINDINNGEDTEQVWFEANIQESVNDENIDYWDNFSTIWDLIRKTPVFDASNMAWLVPNLIDEDVAYVTNAEVSQVMNPDASDFVAKINDEAVELTKLVYLFRDLNTIKRHYSTVEAAVTNYVKNIAATNPNLTSKQIWRAINGDLDGGRWSNILVDKVNEEWLFYHEGTIYRDIDRLADAVIPAEGPVERIRFKSVMEFKKIYDYLIPETTKNVAVYLTHLLENLPANFDNKPIIEASQKLWTSLAARMDSMKGKYYPRIFTEETASRILYKHIALQILRDRHPRTAVEELIARARAWTNEPDEFQEMVKREYAKISVDKFSGFIYSWMKQRSVDERLFDEGDYILDDPIAHTKHKSQFITALTNAIVKSEWLVYEEEAFVKGKPVKTINAMHKWFANITSDQYMKSEKVGYNDVKPGDAVAFYYINRTGGESYYKGIVKSITAGRVDLELDPEMLERKIRADIRHYNEIHGRITRNPRVRSNAPATESQKETLERLASQGYGEGYQEGMTILQASQAIIDGLNGALDDRQNWGKFDANKVYIKQFQGVRSIHKKGFERAVYKKTDARMDDINLITTVLFLSAPGSGVKNYTDAMYRITQQVGFTRYTGLPHQIHMRLKKIRDNNPALYQKLMSIPGFAKIAASAAKNEKSIRAEASAQLAKFKEPMRTGNFQDYTTLLEPYWREDNALPINREDLHKQMEIGAAIAAQYLIEHGYAQEYVLGTEYIPTEELTKKIGTWKTAKSKIEKYGLYFFSGAEGYVRRMSAFMFAIKAVVVDKETDPHKIYEIIDKGVGRANSLYEMMYRKLGEGSPTGQFLMKFTQFNTNQLDNILMQLEIGKQEGQVKSVFDKIKQGKLLEAAEAIGFNISMMTKKEHTIEYPDGQRITYRASASKDPLILRRMAKELWQDTIAKTLFMPIANLRTGNPVNAALTMAIIFLGNFIYHGGDLPDEWDVKDWLFTILSFAVGVPITASMDIVYGLMTDRDLVQTLPNPRIVSGTGELVNLTADLISPKRVKKGQGVKAAWYTWGKGANFFFGINPFPHTRKYYDPDVNKLREKGALNLLLQGANPFNYVPFVNLMEYYDQKRTKSLF